MNTIDLPTKCEGCKNALFDDCKQNGCKFNMLEKLGGKINDEEVYYSLSKICLYKNKKEDEVDIKLGYIFILKDLHKVELLKYNISKIKSKSPLWIGISIVSNDLDVFASTRDDLVKLLHDICPHNIVINNEDYSDYYKLDQFLKYYKNGWTYVNEVGDYFRSEAKDILTDFILTKGKKAALISSDVEQINDICFYNYIYKYLNGNKMDFNEEVAKFYYKNFYDKVYEKDQKMILDWRDL